MLAEVGETHLEGHKKASDITTAGSEPAFYKAEIKYLNTCKAWIGQSEYDESDIGNITVLAVNKQTVK
ncbi:hypothetical protein [Pedobacter metabolipauper]|uniref:Uncharacterized protein n=1 Tax=Pedobacter metabolipauper TaxID=425513 RepID=A0A4R6SV74_9SPHI|nr:hypothetical protein [Pedobacter metabolipauper]TDQ09226.1 hypothetical protein ATK78_1380 [Pedobacter metabolipauper]